MLYRCFIKSLVWDVKHYHFLNLILISIYNPIYHHLTFQSKQLYIFIFIGNNSIMSKYEIKIFFKRSLSAKLFLCFEMVRYLWTYIYLFWKLPCKIHIYTIYKWKLHISTPEIINYEILNSFETLVRDMAGSSRGQNPQRVKMTKAKHNFFLSRQLTSSRHSCRTRRFYNECICKPWFYLNVTLPNLKIAMAVYNYQLKNTNLNLT